MHLSPSRVNVLVPPQADAARVLLAADADPKAFEALREFKYAEPAWAVPHAEHAGTAWYANSLLVDTTRHPRFCVTSGASILAWTDGKWVVESSTE